MSKLSREQISYLEDCIQSLEFGSILITVHNGEITQIDMTEKKRFAKEARK